MKDRIIYIKCKRNVICKEREVLLRDVASLWCMEEDILERLKELRVHCFKNEKYVVVSIMRIIQEISRQVPESSVISLGETEVILEPAYQKSKSEDQKKSVSGVGKILLVSGICFFGTGFTIMAFQNDIGINGIFTRVYEILMGEESKGLNVLQFGYALGLLTGILLFFNHVGKKKITSDPTPIQVSMKNYEDDVNNTLVQMAERGGREKDV